MSQGLISHIGIAVKDLEAAIEQYGLVSGENDPAIEEVTEQKVRVALINGTPENKAVGGARIELLSATAEDSPVAGFINKRGEGLHHICVYVDDIEKKLAELTAAGVRLIDKTPRIGAEGHRIAFVHPASMNGVLIELEERPK